MKSFLLLCVGCVMALQVTGISFAKESRLLDLGNGIVQDTHTGLMWQEGKSRKNFTTDEEAKTYTKDLKLGDFSDWRIPTLAERWDLLQIFMYKNNNGVEFPKAKSRYWTAETDKGLQPIKLDFSCLCLANEEVDYSKKGYVRAVRNK